MVFIKSLERYTSSSSLYPFNTFLVRIDNYTVSQCSKPLLFLQYFKRAYTSYDHFLQSVSCSTSNKKIVHTIFFYFYFNNIIRFKTQSIIIYFYNYIPTTISERVMMNNSFFFQLICVLHAYLVFMKFKFFSAQYFSLS